MRNASLFGRMSALVLLPLAIAIQTGPAAAQAKQAAPAAATTLDVCEDSATGKWVYSGVVALTNERAAADTTVKIDYVVQNKTAADYQDVYRLARTGQLVQGAVTQVVPYSIAAAPLVLGTLRNLARVQINGQPGASAPVVLEPTFAVTAALCGCHEVKGCVRTQGYWGNKPGVGWPAPYVGGNYFFSSGLTLQGIFDTPPQGSGYLILAKQYLAAVLNIAAGASAPAGVLQVINSAAAFFASGATIASCGAGECETQKNWAAILDSYNNGQYPGAPKACPD